MLTLLGVPGSAPRRPGAHMIVTGGGTVGTVGGGSAESQAVEHARRMLGETSGHRAEFFTTAGDEMYTVLCEIVDRPDHPWRVASGREGEEWVGVVSVDAPLQRVFVCGDRVVGDLPAADQTRWAVARARELLEERRRVGHGAPGRPASHWSVGAKRTAAPTGGALSVEEAPAAAGGSLFFDIIRPPELQIAVFGAGHVGGALVDILRHVPCQVMWIDDRREMLRPGPEEEIDSCPSLTSAGDIRPRWSLEPAAECAAVPPGALCVVMTHSHDLDREICGRLLRRDELPFVGLLGSRRKRDRFEQEWRLSGLREAQIARLVCPVGIGSIRGRDPGAIAVAVAAQLLEVDEALQSGGCPR